jgi:hypothetical protein
MYLPATWWLLSTYESLGEMHMAVHNKLTDMPHRPLRMGSYHVLFDMSVVMGTD